MFNCHCCFVFQPFFIDHNSKKTTFIDPRLPLEAPLARSRALIGQLSRQRSHSLDDDTRASSRVSGGIFPGKCLYYNQIPKILNSQLVLNLQLSGATME